jgi:hypothetical protein
VCGCGWPHEQIYSLLPLAARPPVPTCKIDNLRNRHCSANLPLILLLGWSAHFAARPDAHTNTLAPPDMLKLLGQPPSPAPSSLAASFGSDNFCNWTSNTGCLIVSENRLFWSLCVETSQSTSRSRASRMPRLRLVNSVRRLPLSRQPGSDHIQNLCYSLREWRGFVRYASFRCGHAEGVRRRRGRVRYRFVRWKIPGAHLCGVRKRRFRRQAHVFSAKFAA